jgi:hypothetical protein
LERLLGQLQFGFFRASDCDDVMAAAFDQLLERSATLRMIFNKQYSHS